MVFRDHFPILQSKTYLNSCSQGALSEEVKQAYADYLLDWDEKGSPWELWIERLETTRDAFAGLIHAHPDELAVVTSVSHAVSSLASSLHFDGERDKIVLSDFEFPTIAQIWHAQESRGAKVMHVPAAGSSIPLERFEEAIDERTLLVSITHVCYRNGSRLDVPEIVRLAHAKGALVLLDAYQTLGTLPLDAHELEVDFLVGGTLKYLLSSAGLAFLYVRRELLPSLHPTFIGWFSQEEIFAMDIYGHRPASTARQFEAGTPPVPNIYAGLAGIKLIQEIGLEAIQTHIQALTSAIKAGAAQRGYDLGSPADPDRHGALITLRSQKVDLLVERLKEDEIITSSRDDNLRVSPHFYNDLTDVDRLMDGLEKNQALLV